MQPDSQNGILEILKHSNGYDLINLSKEISYDVLFLYCNYIYNKKNNVVEYPENRILKKLGYDINDEASSILRDIVLYTVEAIDKKGIKEAIELINNENSYIYVELAYFDYEIGLTKVKSELNRIHEGRNISNIDIELHEEIFGNKYKYNINDAIISIAKYIRNQNSKAAGQVQKSDEGNKKRVLA